jgi:translation initiation factor 1
MGLFDGTRLERPVTCERCEKPLPECKCPRDASGQIVVPGEQIALLRLEKRGKGKIVTLVEGLDPDASDLSSLLKQLQSRCATGGTLREKCIELQGDHRPAASQLLESLGYKINSP